MTRLDEALAEATDPPVLVAHSLGCLTVLHWLAAGGERLVAPLLREDGSGIEKRKSPELT
ncbi:hypothetical protein DMC64_27190 [Amycolatopsis sp. WAC 04197]|uniref:alpha/beta hydrolase n=1 Tax=Amycolatopsis sp. WAC 04197 TaxID=2203199 RepID=UPI000F79C600|nr:alpha/beta hydrolase [Amycolatopsis sp. WAC 04197]RSN41805.1 hypothetical protein DMC64_27190 [Amycolatopsis sp. WAC 04197]